MLKTLLPFLSATIIIMAACAKTKTVTETVTKTVYQTDTVKIIQQSPPDTVFSNRYQVEIRGEAIHGNNGWPPDTLHIPQLTAGVIATSTVTVLIQACPPTGPYSILSDPNNSIFPQDTLQWYSMPFDAKIGSSILTYSLYPGAVAVSSTGTIIYPYFTYNFLIKIEL